MSASIRDNPKKRGRPKTTGKGLLLGVRLHPPDLARVDEWIATQPDPQPSRPESIRRLVEMGLATVGSSTSAPISNTALDRQIAKQKATIAEIPEHSAPSPEAGMAAMDKAVAKNDLIDMKNKRTRRNNATRK